MIYPSSHCIALIKQFEGLRTTAYKCPAGVWTIGYGHTEGVKKGDVVTQGVAERLLVRDLEIFAVNLNRAMLAGEVTVTQNQFDALASFAYNVGLNNLIKSTLWGYLQEGNDQAAADEFLKWNKATNSEGEKVVLKGLTLRREAERKLFLSGTGLN